MKPPNLIRFLCKIKIKSGAIVDHLSIPAMSREQAETNLKKIYYKCEVLEIIEPKVNAIEDIAYDEVLSLIVNE